MIAFIVSLFPFFYALYSLTYFLMWHTGWVQANRRDLPSIASTKLFPNALDNYSVGMGSLQRTVADDTMDIETVVKDFLLVSAFGVQHSLMARPAVKRFLVKIGLPVHLERSLYVLASAVMVHLFVENAQGFGPVLYETRGVLRTSIQSLRLFGFAFLHFALMSFNMFDLLGVQQAWAPEAYKATLNRKPTLTADGLWGFVRHPIMTGFFVTLWAAPDMTVGRLYINVLFSIYILVAVFAWEEPELRCAFAKYEQYQKIVPAFFPHSINPASLKDMDRQVAAKAE